MLTFVLIVVLFSFGACLGSFCSALIYRVRHKAGDMLTGRSVCPACEEQLLWYHLFPIISWLALSGSCGHCRKKIPVRYLFLEVFFGAVFAFFGMVLLQGGFFSAIGFGVMLFVLFVVLFLSLFDFIYGEVPDVVSVSSIGVMLCVLVIDSVAPSIFGYIRPIHTFTIVEGVMTAMVLYGFFVFQNLLAGAIHCWKEKKMGEVFGLMIAYLVLPFWWTVALVVGEDEADATFPIMIKYNDFPIWVGGGDLRYAVFIGLASGVYLGVVSFIIGYISGALYGIVLILQGRKDEPVPFVPFLGFGWLMAILCMVFV